jgi:hypothetical protein
MNPSGLLVPASGYRLATNRTSFRVIAPSAGVAVLGETYLPDDFRAALNGRPVPYFRVNQAFKGIAIPASGEWDVTFEYRPRHWTESLLAASAGLAVLFGLTLMARRR